MRRMILILDCDARTGQTAARRVRAQRVYCEVHPFADAAAKVVELNPGGIIIAGRTGKGPAATPPAAGIPVFDYSEYSDGEIDEPLCNFLFNTCECTPDWNMSEFLEQSVREIRETVGDRSVLCALSGGVDSAVAASLVSRAVGKQLTCIFVDTGLMRLGEGDDVETAFRAHSDSTFLRIDAQDRFLTKLRGVTEPEQKRKIIGEEFIRVFEEAAKRIGKVDFLVQGTIYPDVIESGIGDSAVIKSHHNVGGLPDAVDFKGFIEPLRLLFKDEVRELGAVIGLPEHIVRRQPFPGPGLAIRCIGEVTSERLKRLRLADAIFREEVECGNLTNIPSQYFAVLTDIRSVGVTGGNRTYDSTVVLRAVATSDFMTAEWAMLPYEVLDRASRRIVREVAGVNRVVYDITSKPPATIEWE